MPRDIAAAAFDYAKVLFENDVVRVVELIWKKGLKIDMHSHPTYFAYGITPLKYKSMAPNGKTQNRSLKKSEVVWYEAKSHAVESVGRTGRALIVELK